ncbi:DUF5689 domain-containing protein [Urechidicola croceus]|uniref:DUF5689 domain-containing protein n=1 Tax=Urechidicola croceus TaxID=1850246 RepID=A0A1D8P8U7_9FLAO|nr:DUF5689 domain-containing protein [Urechidicola croceus]AOW20987.1 hypothetical protein LPB138_09995 [Urechidicola croceus]
MKAIKFLKFIALVAITVSTVSCVNSDDYEIPVEADAAINPANGIQDSIASGDYTEISISDLKDLMVAGEVNQISAENDMYVKGYVVSSDETGNFYQEFYMQDSPSEPTAGIKIVLNETDSFVTYNIGREVYIKLNGLYIGETNNYDGVVAIGGKVDDNGTEIDAMTGNQVPMHVFRSNVVETIVPLEVNLSEINTSHVGMFVKALNVQFPESLVGKTYFDPTDQYDSARTMQSCEGFDYTEFTLETSEFASFKDNILPDGNGTVSGIVSQNYNGSTLVLALNTPSDIEFLDSRCSPLNIEDFTVIFEEDFNDVTDNTNLNIADWTNYAEEGSELWTEQVFSGNGYAEFSAYRTGDDVNIGWLVSPGIDLDDTDSEFLNFKTAQHHLDSDDNTLEVFISTDFNGADVDIATWEPVSANLASRSDSWYAFVDSGLIDLSTYSGTIYVGYKFVGSGTDETLDGAYHVEDFRVLAN